MAATITLSTSQFCCLFSAFYGARLCISAKEPPVRAGQVSFSTPGGVRPHPFPVLTARAIVFEGARSRRTVRSNFAAESVMSDPYPHLRPLRELYLLLMEELKRRLGIVSDV